MKVRLAIQTANPMSMTHLHHSQSYRLAVQDTTHIYQLSQLRVWYPHLPSMATQECTPTHTHVHSGIARYTAMHCVLVSSYRTCLPSHRRLSEVGG